MQISNIKILNVITIFVTISILLPLAGDNLPYIIRSHHLWAMIWLYSLILFNLKLLENRIIIYCLLYGLLSVNGVSLDIRFLVQIPDFNLLISALPIGGNAVFDLERNGENSRIEIVPVERETYELQQFEQI